MFPCVTSPLSLPRPPTATPLCTTHLQIMTCTTRTASRTTHTETHSTLETAAQTLQSLRPSRQDTQHAQKQTTQQTTLQTRRPHSRHVPDGFCRENHVVKRFFFQNLRIPTIPFTFILQHVAYIRIFSVRCDRSVHISHMTRASAVSACVWFHVTHPPASVMSGQSRSIFANLRTPMRYGCFLG